MDVMRTKSVERSIRETDEPEHKLKKSLGTLDLIVFGVGVIIGAGIFVITGTVAATNSGPAITISFAIAGLACALAALCYAEFASTVPVAGSAYTFSYATFGELIAWIIGWDLALEFTIGSAALATSFSGYLQTVLDGTPFEIPASIGSAAGGVIDLPAVIISLLVMGVLIAGIRFSSVLNQIVVAIKLLVVAAVILVGVTQIDPDNYTPFIPEVAARARGQRRLHGPDPDQHAARRRPGGLRHGRGHRRRLDRVLRVHRLRHRGHHRRGDQEPAARHPARHPRVAGDRHRALHGGQPGHHRHAELRRHRPQRRRPAVDRVRRGRHGVDGQPDRHRRLHRPHRRGDDPDARPDPGRLRDGPRRPAAGRPGQGAPEVRHAVHLHRDHRCRRRPHRRAGRPGDPGPPGQHRHALRVRAGERRRGDPAPQAPRPRAVLPDPGDLRRRHRCRCCCAST